VSNGGLVSEYELKRMWKEATMAPLEVLFQSLPGRTEESHKEASYNNVPAKIQMGYLLEQRSPMYHVSSTHNNIHTTVLLN
jgi:hypothetical protein